MCVTPLMTPVAVCENRLHARTRASAVDCQTILGRAAIGRDTSAVVVWSEIRHRQGNNVMSSLCET